MDEDSGPNPSRLLSDLPWSIVLPAGCGKTQLIVGIAAATPTGSKPLLILTHTNAGVDALRSRLRRLGVEPKKYDLLTIDSWAKFLSGHFRVLATSNDSLAVNEGDWSSIRAGALKVIESEHIADLIRASYSASIVDEYQDCDPSQHAIISKLKEYIPVGVLGDPLQGIFEFGSSSVVDWDAVEAIFPTKSLEIKPYRWIERNPELGESLLAIRKRLLKSQPIDLSQEEKINWIEASPKNQRDVCFEALHREGKVIALHQQANQCYSLGRNLKGCFGVMEEIQCRIVRDFIKIVDEGDSGKIASATLKFARDCCIGIGNPLDKKCETDYSNKIKRKFQKGSKPSASISALNDIVDNPSTRNIRIALKALRDIGEVFRREAWVICVKVLEAMELNPEKTGMEILDKIRGRTRFIGRFERKRLLSRTLLVKGLEYDECIVLNADGMNARNLYVALTRGIDKVTVLSSSPVITPTGF
ncbi:MAG: UvrD-helicase domain-containing protein [Candidatus Curtissbacteria bacterium]|nr:UvrD-helicase domain-containing protein [Candidatus Curtissbacteria bacterium]